MHYLITLLFFTDQDTPSLSWPAHWSHIFIVVSYLTLWVLPVTVTTVALLDLEMSYSDKIEIGQWTTRVANIRFKCGAHNISGIIDTGATTTDFWSRSQPRRTPIKRVVRIGSQLVTGIVDTGTDVNIVSSTLAMTPTFQEASFRGRGHCTVSLCGEPVTLHDPYRVLIEIPDMSTAYFETFYVSPVPMTMDMVLKPALPFNKTLSSLVFPLHRPEYQLPLDFHKLFPIPHAH